MGALEIPVGTYHRSISGNEDSFLLNQSIRDPGLKSSQCCGNSWSSQPSRPAPKRYKQAIQVWIGVAGLSLMLGPLVATLLGSWPEFLRFFINTGITVALLTYWVMPLRNKVSGSCWQKQRRPELS